MQREPRDFGPVVRDPSWRRIERLRPEAERVDGFAAIVFLLGLAAIVLLATLGG